MKKAVPHKDRANYNKAAGPKAECRPGENQGRHSDGRGSCGGLKASIPALRLSSRIFFFPFVVLLLYWQFAIVYNVFFFYLMKRLQLYFLNLYFSCNTYFWLAIILVLLFVEIFKLMMYPKVNTHTLTKARSNN